MRTSSEDEHTQRGRTDSDDSQCWSLPRRAPTRHMAVVRLRLSRKFLCAVFASFAHRHALRRCCSAVAREPTAASKHVPGMEHAAPSTLDLDDRFTRQSRTACACETRAACDGSVREHGARSGRPQHAPLTLEAEADVHGSDSGAACMLCHREEARTSETAARGGGGRSEGANVA